MNYDTDKIIKGKTYRVNKHIGRVNGDSTANVRESFSFFFPLFFFKYFP